MVKESPQERSAPGEKEREPIEVSEMKALENWNENDDVTSLLCTNTVFRRFIPRRENVSLTLFLNNVLGFDHGGNDARFDGKGGQEWHWKTGQEYSSA